METSRQVGIVNSQIGTLGKRKGKKQKKNKKEDGIKYDSYKMLNFRNLIGFFFCLNLAFDRAIISAFLFGCCWGESWGGQNPSLKCRLM